MNKSSFFFLVFVLLSCADNKKSVLVEDYQVNKDSLMLQIVPFVAKLHDSIPHNERFLKKNQTYMKSHSIERQYQWLNFFKDSDSFYYFQIARLEPSINNDKFAAICGKFKLLNDSKIDSASFTEIYWTWKMKKENLMTKSSKLFELVIDKKPIEPYQYPQAKEDWIEFPSDKVYYDKQSQSWKLN